LECDKILCCLLTNSQFMDDLTQLGQFNLGMFIILYADDILLIAPSIRQLQDQLILCVNLNYYLSI